VVAGHMEPDPLQAGAGSAPARPLSQDGSRPPAELAVGCPGEAGCTVRVGERQGSQQWGPCTQSAVVGVATGAPVEPLAVHRTQAGIPRAPPEQLGAGHTPAPLWAGPGGSGSGAAAHR